MSCLVMMLPADPLFKISLMAWPSILASIYMVVIGFFSRTALLNNGILIVFSKSKGKIATSNLSLVTVAGRMLLFWKFGFWVALLPEFRECDPNGELEELEISWWTTIADLQFCVILGLWWPDVILTEFWVVSELIGVDRLLVAAVDILQVVTIDILLVAVVDKLESNILVLGKLAAVSLAGKCFDIVPDFVDILEFEIGDQSFYIDFPIAGGYKHCSLL
ncbi:hypothetical protein G9A89_000722 [Geosiphon pyriformis]|nr:hypothetical protein G9A89_000722 [Geosiphon pyriformis]